MPQCAADACPLSSIATFHTLALTNLRKPGGKVVQRLRLGPAVVRVGDLDLALQDNVAGLERQQRVGLVLVPVRVRVRGGRHDGERVWVRRGGKVGVVKGLECAGLCGHGVNVLAGLRQCGGHVLQLGLALGGRGEEEVALNVDAGRRDNDAVAAHVQFVVRAEDARWQRGRKWVSDMPGEAAAPPGGKNTMALRARARVQHETHTCTVVKEGGRGGGERERERERERELGRERVGER